MSRFDGRVALVTGGARGLGREAALELARRGAVIAVADRKIGLAEETANLCRDYGVEAAAFEYDQADALSVAAMVEQVREAYGGIHLLFANAGTGRFAPLIAMTSEGWDLVIRINLSGTFYVCQNVARLMIAQRQGGRIVLTASSGARVMADQLGAYCTAKAGLLMLTRQLASELGNHRITVNAINPGVIATDMTEPMLSEPRWRNMVVRETPVGRWGAAQEVAKLVAFLLSDDAAYINGEDVMIDGGSTLHAAPRWYALDYSDDHNCDWSKAFRSYPYA